MTKPKTLEQLRAEKERAETQLAQEKHKLNRLENRKKYLEQSVQAATSTKAKKTTQPSGAATPRNSDAHKRIAVPKAFCVLREHLPAKIPKRQSLPLYPLATQGFRTAQNGQRVEIAPPSKAPLFRPVSRCVRFFSESRVCAHFRL